MDRVRFDSHGVTFEFMYPPGECEPLDQPLSISLGAFTLRKPNGEALQLDASGSMTEELGAVLPLFNEAVETMTLGNDGLLDMRFRDGAQLRAGACQDVESWELRGGPDHLLVVCLGGGELAVWD